MARILNEFLLYCCVAAFVTGVVLAAASAELGRPMPPPGMPGPFALSDCEALTRLLHEAAFADVTVSGVPVPLHAASFEA